MLKSMLLFAWLTFCTIESTMLQYCMGRDITQVPRVSDTVSCYGEEEGAAGRLLHISKFDSLFPINLFKVPTSPSSTLRYL